MRRKLSLFAMSVFLFALIIFESALAATLPSNLINEGMGELPSGLPDYYIQNMSGSGESAAYTVPKELSFTSSSSLPVDNIAIFDHPASADFVNFNKSPSEILLEGFSNPFFAQDYVAVPGDNIVPKNTDSCALLVQSCSTEQTAEQMVECVKNVLPQFKSDGFGANVSDMLDATQKPFLESGNDYVVKFGALVNQIAWFGVRSICQDADAKFPELALADVWSSNGSINNSAKRVSPYAEGFPLSLGAFDAAVVKSADGTIDGIATLFKNPQPDEGILQSNIAFYRFDDAGVLRMSTLVSPTLSNLQKCNVLKNNPDGEGQVFKTLTEVMNGGCLFEVSPIAIASADFNSDGRGDIVTIYRIPFNKDYQTNVRAAANLYLSTGDDNKPFIYAGYVGLDDAPYFLEPDSKGRKVFVSTKDGVSEISYNVANGKVAVLPSISASFFPDTLGEGFRPYQIAVLPSDSGCDSLAVTWAKIKLAYENDYAFKNYFSVYKGQKTPQVGICVYSAHEEIMPNPSKFAIPAPMVSTLEYAPAIEARGIPAGVWVGDQLIYDKATTPKAKSWFIPLDDSGNFNTITKVQYTVSDDMNYVLQANDQSTVSPGCGVKKQKVDKFGNLFTVIGCPMHVGVPSSSADIEKRGSVTVMINKAVAEGELCTCDNYKANPRLCSDFNSSRCEPLPPCTCNMRLIDPSKCDVRPLGAYNTLLKKYAACTTSQVTCSCDNYKDESECSKFFDSSVCIIPPQPEECSCANYKDRTDCPSEQFNPQACGETPPPPVDCTCDDYLMRGSACPNPQDFFDTNGNGVADKCETVTGVTGDCTMLVGKNGMPAVGDWAVGSDYDNYIRLLNRRASEIYCNEVKKRGGVCDPDKNPHDIFVGELGVFSFKCVQAVSDNFGVWQISGFPIGPDFYGETGVRSGQFPEEIDLPDGGKMSRKTYLTNTATRLFAVAGTGAQSSSGKALLASSVPTDFLPSIVKSAKKQFVNTTLTPSLSSSNGSFNVAIGKDENDPYMLVRVKQLNMDTASAMKSSFGYTGTAFRPADSGAAKSLVVEITGRAGLDIGQFYAPPAQASTSRNLDPNQFLDAFAEALAKQPASLKTPNFSKAMRDANEIYPWDEYMRVSNAVGNNEAAYNIMPLYYVGATSGGKSGFGCSLIR